MTRSRGRQVDVEIKDRIDELMLAHFSAPAILRELDRLKTAGELTGQVPGLRTIQRLMAEIKKRDQSGPWSFGDSAELDSAPVLDALAAILVDSAGRIQSVTRREAELITRVARARPEIPPDDQWRIARQYIARAEQGEEATDLDILLALAPWRSDEARVRYSKLASDGHIPRIPGIWASVIAGTTTLRLLRRLIHPESELDERLAAATLG